MKYSPGDTFVLQASLGTYSYIGVEDFHGTEACPIKVINEGGQVLLTYGFIMNNVTHVKILGNGSRDTYGIKIQNPLGATQNSFGFGIRQKSSDIEISNIEIDHTFIGISIESDGDCDTTISSWVMNNIVLHDNYVHDSHNQAFYIGNTSPNNSATSDDPRPVVCNGVTSYPLPARMGNVKIYNNVVDKTGRPGIQLSSASEGVSEIYNNKVSNSGDGTDDAQGVGIFAGGYTNAIIYNNTVSNTFTAGIASFGAGVTIKNNTISNSGRSYSGATVAWPPNIWVSVRKTEPLTPTTFLIKDNILSNPGSSAKNIMIERDYDSYTSQLHRTYTHTGSAVCNNLDSSGSPASLNIDRTINWSTDCLNYTVANAAPVISAGTNQSIFYPSSSAVLSGYAKDEDGIRSTVWTKIFGPQSGTILSPSSLSTSVSGLVPGAYTYRLTVTDNKGSISRDEVRIVVYPNVSACSSKTIVVIGSSTAYGTGAWPSSRSWVNEYTKYLQGINPNHKVINLALGGTNSYLALPSGTVPPADRPDPDTTRNITAALAYKPQAIIVNYPTNDAASGFSLSEQRTNIQTIVRAAQNAGVPIWIASTQPRDDLSQAQRNDLMTFRDWIFSTYPNRSLDFWTDLANADGTIIPEFGAGDSIHFGNYGHDILRGRLINSQILENVCGM